MIYENVVTVLNLHIDDYSAFNFYRYDCHFECMYVLVIFRQGGPVQLKIGLNGVCVNNVKARP